MNFEGILQLIMDNYSSFIATLALLLSALTFIMSQRHTKKNKIISDETSISFAYHSLQSESMARATPANMPH